MMNESSVGSIDVPILDARFVRAYPPAVPSEDVPILYLPFRGDDLVTSVDYRLLENPVGAEPTGAWGLEALHLGRLDGRAVVTYRSPASEILPEDVRATGLRSLFGCLDDDEYALAGYAVQLLRWRETYRFCSRCGTAAVATAGTWGMECPNCGHGAYPPVTPAILALIHDGGDRVLLATKPGWGKRYSIVAGFTEPGESLEGCVIREVLEEVGVHARDLVYDGSQAWPFPHQLMIGFNARWISGEICIDTNELADARWFHVDDLPDLPGPLSLSRQIIDRWVASRRHT